MSLGSQHLVDVSPHIPVLLWNEICHGKWHKDVLENPLSSTTSSAKQWAVISTVYSISHRQFPELTAILFWCSTKLPVLPYSPLCWCYIPQLFVTATKQTRDSRNRGFVWMYIPRTPSPFEEAIDQAWLNTFARSYPYVHTSAQMSTKVHDRSCCMTAVHPPTFIYETYWRADLATRSNPKTPYLQSSPKMISKWPKIRHTWDPPVVLFSPRSRSKR